MRVEIAVCAIGTERSKGQTLMLQRTHNATQLQHTHSKHATNYKSKEAQV
jgi:hypothetical protein